MRPVKKKPLVKNFPNEIPVGKVPQKDKVFHFLVMTAAAAIIMVVVKMASAIITPVLMALFLTVILIVPLRWLRQKGLPNVVALVIVLGCTAILFAGLGVLVGQSLNDFVKQFPKYKTKIIRKFDSLEQNMKKYGFSFGEKEEKNGSPEQDVNSQENGHENGAVPPQSTEPSPQQAAPDKSKDVRKNQEKPPPIRETVTPGKAREPLVRGSDVSSFVTANLFGEIPHDADVEALDAEDETPWRDRVAAKPDTEDEHEDDILDDEELENADLDSPVFRYDEFTRAVKSEPHPPLTELKPETVMHWVGKFVLELRNLAGSGFLVMIITFFMIFEASRFPEKVDWAMGGKAGPINKEHLHHIASEIRRYLFIKSVSCLMSSSAALLVYWAFGVPGYLLWGVVAFFLYFIPNIGGIVAAIIPGLLIFMMMDLEGVLTYAICLVCIECSIGYGIEPKMLGHGLGISTVVIFLSLLWWGWILGPVGLFLAAPLTIMVKIILQAFEETRWIAILLGDKDHPATEDAH